MEMDSQSDDEIIYIENKLEVIIADDDDDDDDEGEEDQKPIIPKIEIKKSPSMESLHSASANESDSHEEFEWDMESTSDQQKETARLIRQIMELQNTLDDLSKRLNQIKVENLRLKSENMVLNQYIENLMSATSVFTNTQPAKK